MGRGHEVGRWPGCGEVRRVEACKLQGQAARQDAEGAVADAAWVSAVFVMNDRKLRISRYSAPFDRHDWVVDRCGTRMRYVIDFYTGHNGSSSSSNLSFYLDVRPALDNWEGVRLRAQHFWNRCAGYFTSPSTPPEPAKTRS